MSGHGTTGSTFSIANFHVALGAVGQQDTASRERERKIHTHTPSHYSNTGDERKTAISEPQSQASQLHTPRGGRRAPQPARRGIGNGGNGSDGGKGGGGEGGGEDDSSDSSSSSSHSSDCVSELHGPRHGSDAHHPRDSYLAPALPERGGGAGLTIGKQHGLVGSVNSLELKPPSSQYLDLDSPAATLIRRPLETTATPATTPATLQIAASSRASLTVHEGPVTLLATQFARPATRSTATPATQISPSSAEDSIEGEGLPVTTFSTRKVHMQHTATHFNTLQLALLVTIFSTMKVLLQHTATHCSALQHTLSVTIFSTRTVYLQHNATHCNNLLVRSEHSYICYALQQTATHCNALQHTATHCNTPCWSQSSVRGRYICNTVQLNVQSHRDLCIILQ